MFVFFVFVNINQQLKIPVVPSDIKTYRWGFKNQSLWKTSRNIQFPYTDRTERRKWWIHNFSAFKTSTLKLILGTNDHFLFVLNRPISVFLDLRSILKTSILHVPKVLCGPFSLKTGNLHFHSRLVTLFYQAISALSPMNVHFYLTPYHRWSHPIPSLIDSIWTQQSIDWFDGTERNNFCFKTAWSLDKRPRGIEYLVVNHISNFSIIFIMW